MESLPDEILIEILLHCDFKVLMAMLVVNKTFFSIISSSAIWPLKYTGSQPSTFTTLAYYKFPSALSLMNSLRLLQPPKTLPLSELRPIINSFKNPKSIILKAVAVSSQDMGQGADCTLRYDDGHFWSSKSNESNETDEFAIYKLKSKSYVFTVSFKVYRALYQGGVLYPPQRVRVCIGNTPSEFHYFSEEFTVPMSEAYNTIAIIPNLIEGQFVKLELLGKVMKEPGSERFYSVLSFVEIVGAAIVGETTEGKRKGTEDIEDIIARKDLEGLLRNEEFLQQRRTPFIYDRIESAGLLEGVLMRFADTRQNEIEQYLMTVNMERLGIESDDIYASEITANYFFFEKKDYKAAKDQYLACRDFWGLCRPLIMLEDYDILRDFIRANSPRYPRLHDILRIAKELGSEYEENIRKTFSE